MIWSAELGRTMRSARVVVLLALYVMFTGMALLVVHSIARQITHQIEQQVKAAGIPEEELTERRQEARKQFIQTFFSNDEAMTEALAVIPLVLLVVFKTTLRFLPLYAGVMGFDQLSGEVGPRSIRYLTVRSRRSSVLLGKFLSQATLLAALMLLIDLALCLFGRLTQEGFGTGVMFATLGRFWLSAIVFCLPYLALTTLCSTLFRQPAVSLVMNIIALFGIWLLAFIGELSPMAGQAGLPGQPPAETTSPVAYVRYLSVWHYGSDLLHPEPARFAVASLAHLGFAALFLGLAWLVLRRRDL